MPEFNVEIAKMAWSEETAELPSEDAPSKNCTDPDTPDGKAEIFAVKFTLDPAQAGLLSEDNETVTLALVTVSVPPIYTKL